MALAVLVPLVMTFAGCARHDDVVGTVTEISPRLCIGRHAALGACYSEKAGGDVALSGLRVGECVRVTVADQNITSVEPVPAADHRDDCPGP
jgi:hypothetical protein